MKVKRFGEIKSAGLYGRGPEGAFIANLPSGPFCFGVELAITSKSSRRSAENTAELNDEASETVVFLGREIPRSEYQEICRNLGEYFALLAKWKKESGRE